MSGKGGGFYFIIGPTLHRRFIDYWMPLRSFETEMLLEMSNVRLNRRRVVIILSILTALICDQKRIAEGHAIS